jgi:hypothetical protein
MQHESDMATLKRGLHVTFEYSRLPLDNHIQTIAGRAVSVYRNELLAKISRRDDMPVGFDEAQWHHLVMLEVSPSHAQILAKAPLANASRINLGRTGPKGIAGVTEELAEKLDWELDPEELQEELRRDKGYGKRKDVSENMDPKSTVYKGGRECEDSNKVSRHKEDD